MSATGRTDTWMTGEPSKRLRAATTIANRAALGLVCFLLSLDFQVAAQEAAVAVQQATPASAPMAVPAPGQPGPVGPDGKPIQPGPGARPGQPGQPGQPPNAAAKPGEQPMADGNKAVTRPNKPSLPPDPRELKVKPDPNGKIRFSFHGQPWADVLEWLAAVSAMSLDWQELPGDYLNLVTQRDYTIPEARDLINRHLLARGYTLLGHGEVLSVVKIEKLNPALVPRIEPQDLAKRLPHDYVKVSFPLDWLISEKAVEELKPMLSPNAKLTPLKNTNRLEAIDAAINLQEVYALLNSEQSDEPQKRLVKEFSLQHTRATEVIEQLKSLLGIESKPASQAAMSPQQMEMMQQQQQMMMQQQQRGGQPAAPPKKEEDVRLVANGRKNSILAHAPPDKMEVIVQAIQVIDVESDQAQSLLSNINRMQVYRLHGVDPQTLVKTLMEIGQFDPATRLEVDSRNKAIIAYASLADHLTVRQVVERLDGSGRKFEVIQLRRLESDYVAGTIEFMMLGPPQQKQQQPRYFDYFSSYGRGGGNEQKETDQFRVDADTENNRLLLWANEVELQEVTNLLAKLGEIPSRGGNPQKLRVLDSMPPEELQKLLEKLQQAWPSLAPNQLNLPPTPSTGTGDSTGPRFDSFEVEKEASFESIPTDQLVSTSIASVSDADSEEDAEAPDATDRDGTDADATDSKVKASGSAQPLSETLNESPASVQEPVQSQPNAPAKGPGSRQPEANESPRPAQAGAAPPVSVSLSPDGRLVLFSQDTQALDILEELIGQVSPPRRDYRIYRLKHADSFWVRKNLEDFFKEDDDKKSSNSRHVYYYDSYQQPEKNENRQRLSRKRKLKLIDDLDTNSILVQGADAEQLRTIEDLIRIYDQPQQADANAARVSQVIQVQYSKAQTIATAVKDVYRDLLSSNDKALASNNPEQKNRIPSGANTYIFNEGGEGAEKERTRVTFKGKLSIGIDEITNTLLVSTEGENLMRNVSEMIRSLDDAAKPLSSVSVVKIGGNSNASRVRDVLARMLIEAKPPAKQNGPQRGQQGQQQQPNGENPASDGEAAEAAGQ